MTARKNTADLDVVLAEAGRVEVAGMQVYVKRIRARELISLSRVITKGLGPHLSQIDFTAKDQASQGIALLLMAMPEATEEVLLFLREIIAPVDPEDGVRLTAEMRNPDLDSLFSIVETIVDQEWDDAQRLWGKVTALVAVKRGSSPTGR